MAKKKHRSGVAARQTMARDGVKKLSASRSARGGKSRSGGAAAKASGGAARKAKSAPSGKAKKPSAAPKSKRRASPSAVAVDPARLGEEIALRAFLRWQERGGDEMSNWLDAEREIQAELESLAQAPRSKRRSS